MNVSVARLPLYAAGLAVIVGAAVTGCASSSTGAGTGGASAQAPVSPLAAVQLAAKTANGANSYTGTMDLQATVKPGAAGASGTSGQLSMTGTFAEQLRPSLLASANFTSLNVGGQSLPGGFTEIITPATFYYKWPYLTQQLHVSKPWMSLSVATASKSTGIDLSQFMGEATGNGPLVQSQMLAAATSVRRVGTGTIGSVPVTEYTGKIPLEKAASFLSGSAKTALEQANASDGLTEATFTDWIDAQHIVRKAVVIELGKSISETITVTMTSINQPVNISIPSASQTSPLPSSALG
jgi:hypothetical protein